MLSWWLTQGRRRRRRRKKEGHAGRERRRKKKKKKEIVGQLSTRHMSRPNLSTWPPLIQVASDVANPPN